MDPEMATTLITGLAIASISLPLTTTVLVFSSLQLVFQDKCSYIYTKTKIFVHACIIVYLFHFIFGDMGLWVTSLRFIHPEFGSITEFKVN